MSLWPNASDADATLVAERIEDYLDHLCGPLLGVLTYQKRQEVRREIRTHLEMLVEEFAASGMRPGEAVEAALREYGPPVAYGEDMVEALSGQMTVLPSHSATVPSRTPEVPALFGPFRILGKPTAVAFVCFGSVLILCELLLQFCFGMPRMLRLFPLAAILVLLAPLAAGLMTGMLTPNRAAAGLLRAFGLLIPQTALVGLFLLPERIGLLFALLVAAYWLPMGLISAITGETIARYIRLRRIWKGVDHHAAASPFLSI